MSLEAFLDYVFDKCRGKQQSHEHSSSDIEKAVKELLWRLIKKGLSLRVKDVIKKTILFDGTLGDILPLTQIIPTGSFFEGTRVGEPFEYDFMLLIDVDIDVRDGCGPGYVNVKYPTNKKWADLPANQMLYSRSDTQSEDEYPSLNAIFSTLFETLTTNDVVMSDEEKTVRTSSGVLKALPSCGFHVAALWSDIDQNDDVVSVDIRPAFRCPKHEIDKQVSRGNLPHMLKEFVEEHGVFVVPKQCITPECDRCFLISFASCEMELIKRIDDHHRKCYIILKNMLGLKDMYEDALTSVETYHIKTCLLFHCYKLYPSKCEELSVENCVLNIIDMVLESFRKMDMPSFFLRELSVFQHSSYTYYKIDFIFRKNSEVARILIEHSGNDSKLKPSLMRLASLKMTTEILEMIGDILLYVKTGNVDFIKFINISDAMEDLQFALGYHFTGTAVESVEQNKWLSSLKAFIDNLHLPIIPILRSAIVKNMTSSDISIKTKFPLAVKAVTSPTPDECVGNLVDYDAILVSGWFSIAGNDSNTINYHKNK